MKTSSSTSGWRSSALDFITSFHINVVKYRAFNDMELYYKKHLFDHRIGSFFCPSIMSSWYWQRPHSLIDVKKINGLTHKKLFLGIEIPIITWIIFRFAIFFRQINSGKISMRHFGGRRKSVTALYWTYKRVLCALLSGIDG